MKRSHPYHHKSGRRDGKGLRIVASFEGAKGVLVLLVGFELLTYIHRDIHEAARQLVEHLHLNPASHYPRIFLDLSERIHDPQLWSMAIGAIMYSAMRMLEAIGLWLRKQWAEWFGVLTGGMYIPVEIFEALHHPTWPRISILAVNIGIVSYLALILAKNRDGSR